MALDRRVAQVPASSAAVPVDGYRLLICKDFLETPKKCRAQGNPGGAALGERDACARQDEWIRFLGRDTGG
ncbi:MAG: hypothetical protein HY853_06685 [Burkholderiales bacterium]|nr:hypothetical protein [Burkholderiales bacterium]